VGLDRGPLSLVRIIEELLEWKSSGSGQENLINGWGIRCADHATPSIRKKLALTSPTSGGRSVDIVRLRTKGHVVSLSLFPSFLLIFVGLQQQLSFNWVFAFQFSWSKSK
jgi:hypothetical protein